MVKHLLAVTVAVTLGVSDAWDAWGQSLVQRSDWQDRKIETYLPKPNPPVPWLELDTKTKLPKGDIPLGREVASLGPFVLPPISADIRVTANVTSTFRSM